MKGGAFLEYFPYGETWVHNKADSSGYSTPYKFTGKEEDTETGYYYHGQRSRDPRIGPWCSADKILNDYLDGKRGMGGVFNPINLNLYHYAGWNPIVIIDPDGNENIVFARNPSAKYKKFAETALSYPNGTFKTNRYAAMKGYANIKKALGFSLTKREVERFLGKANRTYKNFSTLPNDPSKQGVAVGGVEYNYKRRDFYTDSGELVKAFVVYDPQYGGVDVRKVLNNRNLSGDSSKYIKGVHIHAAVFHRSITPNDPDYDSGSRACLTRHGGYYGEFFPYLSNKKRDTGKVVIFR